MGRSQLFCNLIRPPCSGKKSLAKYLASKIGYSFVSLEDFFKKHEKEDDN
jgi:hypothetical protein